MSSIPKSNVIKALFKCLLKDGKRFNAIPNSRIRRLLSISQWGSGQFVDLEKQHELLTEFIGPVQSTPSFLKTLETGIFDSYDVVKLIKNEFRMNLDTSVNQDPIDSAFRGFRELSSQLLLAECSSVTTTRNIVIEATGAYLESHSSPEENRYRYIYRIRIHNLGKNAVRITGRHYNFTFDNGEKITVPKGSPGIVGYTPVIKEGETFEYASGVDLETPCGIVEGELHMIEFKDQDIQELFDAKVSKFILKPPLAA